MSDKITEYFLLISKDPKNNFSESLGKITCLKNIEVIEFSETSSNTLNRILKLFNCNDVIYKNFNGNSTQLFRINLLNQSEEILTYNQGNVFSCDLSLLNLIDFLNNALGENHFLITHSVNQFNAISSLIPNFGENDKKNSIIQNLVGEKTWDSFQDLISTLNRSCKWVVLRNFEELIDSPIFNPGDDIDILCDDITFFTTVMNAKKRHGGRCSYYVSVKNQNIPLDIRFVGDKYFDPVWASEMLKRKTVHHTIPVLSKYDYFFSLLYHSKLQKREVKKIYIERLDKLSKELNFMNLSNQFVLDDSLCSKILNAFFNSNKYKYTYTDDAVRNESFLKTIKYKEINDPLNNWRVLIKQTPSIFIRKGIEVIARKLGLKKKFPKIYMF